MAPQNPWGGGGAGSQSGAFLPEQYCTLPLPHPSGEKPPQQPSLGRASGYNVLIKGKALEGLSCGKGASVARTDVEWVAGATLSHALMPPNVRAARFSGTYQPGSHSEPGAGPGTGPDLMSPGALLLPQQLAPTVHLAAHPPPLTPTHSLFPE